MADTATITNSAWVEHHGRGRPCLVGMQIDVRHFNGDVSTFAAGDGTTFHLDGSRIEAIRARWSGWDYHDGGPMGPKFKAWRPHVTAEQRNAEMFQSWLDVREPALV